MKKWLNEEREFRIVELYEKYENARDVANELGVCDETIYRALRKHGIKRTHRHAGEKKSKPRPSHCRTKYCPALIVMLNRQLGYCATKIADATGYKENGVRNVLTKRMLVEKKRKVRKEDFDLDAMECEYLDGVSSYALAEKYGVNRSTICTWMRERGIHLGKGAHQEGRQGRSHSNGEFVYTDKMRDINQRSHETATLRFSKRLQWRFGGRFEIAGEYRPDGKLLATVRCTECGHVFTHSTDVRKNWECPKCRERQRHLRIEERDARRYERMFEEIREYALDKTCKECGTTFHSKHKTSMYCSDRCKRRAQDRKRKRLPNNFRHYFHVKYGDRYRDYYDPSITLRKLYERDGGICQICGEPCDWDERSWGNHGPNYPSVDHIVPRASGGTHHWNNVQLAHCICNSRKRDLANDMAVSEVMSNVS